MELIKTFFQGLFSAIAQIKIPIIDVYADTFLLGMIIFLFLVECINKILGKDSESDKS